LPAGQHASVYTAGERAHTTSPPMTLRSRHQESLKCPHPLCKLCSHVNGNVQRQAEKEPTPGSTSNTISIASFQNGTMVFNPVRLKSSSIKSSVTSQKYSWPGREQNQLIHVRVDVGVDEARIAIVDQSPSLRATPGQTKRSTNAK
jgi:hypothetical protein